MMALAGGPSRAARLYTCVRVYTRKRTFTRRAFKSLFALLAPQRDNLHTHRHIRLFIHASLARKYDAVQMLRAKVE